MKLTATVYTACLALLSFSACDVINIAEEKSAAAPAAMCSPSIIDDPAPLFVVNNEIMHEDSVEALQLELIKKVSVLDPDQAKRRYGTAGKNGVVLVETNQQIKN